MMFSCSKANVSATGGKLENVNWDQINTVKCDWPVISVVAPGNSRLFLLPRREWGRGGKCGEF